MTAEWQNTEHLVGPGNANTVDGGKVTAAAATTAAAAAGACLAVCLAPASTTGLVSDVRCRTVLHVQNILVPSQLFPRV